MKPTLLFLLVLPMLINSQDVDFKWAVQIGTEGYIHRAQSMAIDSQGNVYTTGRFSCTADFDPGPAVYNLELPCSDWEGDGNLFVSKLDAAGNFVWARHIRKNLAGAGFVFGYSIGLDQIGSIYVTGPFKGNIDFDPGACDHWVNSVTPAIFVLKLDSLGEFVWVKTVNNTLDDAFVSNFITVDQVGNIYATGGFNGVIDFDPGNGVTNFTTTNGINMFILKLGAAGDFKWAKQMSGEGRSVGSGMAIDNSGNLLTTGAFIGTVDFNPGTGAFNLVTPGGQSAFMSKVSSNGDFIWAKQIAGNDTSGSVGRAIKIDKSGNILLTGGFWGTNDFDPGAGILNLVSTYQGGTNMFISKYNTEGEAIWAKGIGGNGDNNNPSGGFSGGVINNSTAVDTSGNIYLAGHFYQTVDFDPGPATHNLSITPDPYYFVWPGFDMFILKLNPDGNFNWVKHIRSSAGTYTQQVNPYNIQLDRFGNLYTCGAFISTIDFDPGPQTYNVANPYGVNIFIQKLGTCIGTTTSNLNVIDCKSFTLNGHTYTVSGTYTQTILNSAGCDSIITLTVTLNRPETIINASSCGSYTRCFDNGNCIECHTYQVSGTYTEIYPTANGCDSVVKLVLTVVPVPGPTINVTACNSYYWYGHTYTASGSYIDTISTIGACDTVFTLNLTIINSTSLITSHPIDREICSGENVDFSVTVNSNQAMSYQWQVSSDGVTYVTVNNGAIYSGATTPVLTITGANDMMKGLRFRCKLSNNTCNSVLYSNPGLLTVRKLPDAALTAAPFTFLYPIQTTTLSAAVLSSGGGSLSYRWYKNNLPDSVDGNRKTVTFDQIGDYHVIINERWVSGLVCSRSSNVVPIEAQKDDRLIIHPNPNRGQFSISYYDPSGMNNSPVITIYDSKGAMVYRKKLTPMGIYSSVDIGMIPGASGFYSIVVSDANGKRLATRKVIVR